MYLRNDPANPANMSEEERLDEIASILARGIFRARPRLISEASSDKILLESPSTCLDLSAQARPDEVPG